LFGTRVEKAGWINTPPAIEGNKDWYKRRKCDLVVEGGLHCCYPYTVENLSGPQESVVANLLACLEVHFPILVKFEQSLSLYKNVVASC